MNARSQTIFRLYQLFSGIAFTGPIWAVYLLSRGLTLTQFGLVEASLHVGMLAAQVPTGALADSLGRRRMMVVAGGFTALGELGYVFAPTFGLICLAGAVHGVSFALRTGTDEAYLFDSLAHDDAQAQFPAHARRPVGRVSVRDGDLVHGWGPDCATTGRGPPHSS